MPGRVSGYAQEVKGGDAFDVALPGGVEAVGAWGVGAPQSPEPSGPHATTAAAEIASGETACVEPVKRGPCGRIIGRALANEPDLKYGSSDRPCEPGSFGHENENGLWGDAPWVPHDPVPPWRDRDRAPQIRRREGIRALLSLAGWFYGTSLIALLLTLLGAAPLRPAAFLFLHAGELMPRGVNFVYWKL